MGNKVLVYKANQDPLSPHLAELVAGRELVIKLEMKPTPDSVRLAAQQAGADWVVLADSVFCQCQHDLHWIGVAERIIFADGHILRQV